jgi:hypothetical protein
MIDEWRLLDSIYEAAIHDMCYHGDIKSLKLTMARYMKAVAGNARKMGSLKLPRLDLHALFS